MKEEKKKRVETISAKDYKEFDRLYNSKADELSEYDPEVRDIDPLTARFYYSVTERKVENLEDEFEENNVRCTCSDCPFLKVGTDARRKWFPCEFSDSGETKMTSPACAQFYRKALALMREATGRCDEHERF